MYTLYLHHQKYLNAGPEVSMPFLPGVNDWIEIPVDILQSYWPSSSTETLFVAEKEHLFDESMQFYGTRIYLQDWEGK